MLPPYCVSVPRTSLLVEQIIGMCRPQPETLMGGTFNEDSLILFLYIIFYKSLTRLLNYRVVSIGKW